MIEISLTEFVDFVTKAGSPKLTVVRDVKKRHDEGYNPAADFYKKLRDGIVEIHRRGKPKSALDALAVGITDRNKRRAYPLLIQGYKRFLGNKRVTWFNPPDKPTWTHGDLAVRINPELGLRINGIPHLIKMYLKQEPLRKLAIPTILHLLHINLADKKNPKQIGILDVRHGRLIPVEDFDPSFTPLLEGEALSFANIYRAL